tara:strand:- start:1423 stop:2304 length:882 start_codon:yes stop_codon:yes gene_type:complete
MNESIETKLQNKIKFFFDKESYLEKYNYDIVFTILVILLVVFIVISISIYSRINLEKINWEKNKCNPFYMIISNLINGAGYKFNEENLKSCLNDLTSGIAHDVLQPINSLVNLFSETLKYNAIMLSRVQSFIMYLVNNLTSLFTEFIQRIKLILQENIELFIKINNFLGTILGFFTVIYYKIVLLVDSIKLLFPILALTFLVGVVAPTLYSLLIAIGLLLGFIAITFIPFCFGCWAWGPVAVWSAVVILLTAFFILVVLLYKIFAKTANDILVRILRPISNTGLLSFEDPPSI